MLLIYILYTMSEILNTIEQQLSGLDPKKRHIKVKELIEENRIKLQENIVKKQEELQKTLQNNYLVTKK